MPHKNTFLKLVIISLFLLSPTISKACPNAVDLAGAGADPGTAILADCLELARFDIQTGRGVVQGSIYGLPETDLGLVRAAEEALTRSGTVLRGLSGLGLDPVELYISPTAFTFAGEVERDIMAAAQRNSRPMPDTPRKCIMAAFPTLRLDEYKFTISHEFFHCVQFSSFSAGESGAGAGWWVEGSAEWFASLVYQGSGLSDGWVAEFDEVSATVALTQMNYASVMFFWWLSQNYGNGRVVGLLNTMNGSSGSQEDALAGIIPETDFLKFVTDYLEQSISQPGGRAATSTPVHEDIQDIDQDQEITLEAQRFVAYRTLLKFACGSWTTTLDETKGAYKALRLPSGEWQPLPPEFQSDSEAKIEYIIAGAATREEGFNLVIDAKKTPCIPCQAPDYSDGPEMCLIGEWRLTSGGIGAKIGEMLGDVPELSGVDYPDLDGLLTLRRNGTFTLKGDDDGSMQTSTSQGIFSAEISLMMEKEGTWSVNGEKLVQCYNPIKSISIDETVTGPDGKEETISEDRYLGPPLSYTETRQFICAEGVLEITQKAFFAPTLNWVYEK